MLYRYLRKFLSLVIMVGGVLFLPNIASAAPATIAGFEMAGLLGTEVSFNATTNDVNLQTATISRGAGITPSALANAFSATGFVAAGTKADAITQNEYFQVVIEPKNDHRLFLTTLNYVIRRSGTGPNAFQWQYSLDGFATAGVDIGAEGSYTGTATNGVAMPAIDLSAVPALQNLPSGTKVTFRLYAWGASAGTGTFAIGRLAGDDLAFVGEVLPNKIASFELLGQNGDEATVDATYSDPEVKTVTLSRGNGIIPSILFNAFSARNYTFGGTKADAIADNEYFELTIEAEDFYRLNFNDLHFNARRSSLGPVSYQWQYSLDGFTTAGVDLGAEGLIVGDVDTGEIRPSINLSGVPAMQNVKKVTFRLYAWGGTNVNGTFALGRLTGDDLVFTGTVTPNIIVAFDPLGQTGDQIIFNATTLNANLQNSFLSRGAGINPAFLLDGFSSNDYVVGGVKADALSNNEYVEFKLESLVGYELYLGFLDSNLRRSGTGPNTYQWQYSLDDFATAGVDLGAQFAYLTSEDDGTMRPRVNMSLIPALQNIQPGNQITLRLYAWGATGAPGTFAIGRLDGDDLAIAGELKIKTYNVNYSAGANGSITGNTAQVVNHGASSTAVTAVPDIGYHFVKWSDNSTDNPRIDGNVTANISVTAEFAINTYTLTYLAGVNGSLTGTLIQTVNHGTDGISITAVPAAGYAFSDWSDSSTDNPRTDTNVTGNITVTANFAPTSIPGVVSQGGGGFYPPNGIGSGRLDKTVAMDAVKEIGFIDRDGINLLTFVRSQALFDAMGSLSLRTGKHSIKIVAVDLYRNIVTFEIASDPQTFQLNEDELVKIDLDGDKIPDISIQFMGVYINRVELTIKSLLYGDGALLIDSSIQDNQVADTTVLPQGFLFTRNLETRMIHPDVKELQKFLNNNGFVITDKDLGSPGQETDKFGAFTRNALIRYQIANGISPALGYFGEDTRAVVNRQLNGENIGNAPSRLLGRILLQVQNHGEAWYVRKSDAKRYYMPNGQAAYEMMRSFSLGISDTDLAKIPKVQNIAELNQSSSACNVNTLANRLKGDILLQVQQHGEAWYVDPVKCRAIYLKDGDAAYEIMRFLGLGITNTDLEKITGTK
jgi:hypothetical protein